MIPLFLGLTLAYLGGLVAAAVLGYLALSHETLRQWHMLAGALATLVCCAVHCVVFTYFMATAKWIEHAILVKDLDASLAAATRPFRAQALLAALVAIMMVFSAALLGVMVDTGMVAIIAHHLWVLVMIGVNLLAAGVELAAIRRNGLLIDRVLTIIKATASTDV